MDEEIINWMGTNPRETKLTTNVARSINSSLEKNKSFHNLNRGVLISAKSVHWDNKS
ncbi:MAG: AIPR family protein [Oscillospiraceae bacterium]|nr:AIPR family protein [Oscillospiraceae bacterium]